MIPRRFLLAAVLVWCVAIAATPLLASHGGIESRIASFSYEFFSRVCHQFDSRSFHLAGYKFAVCIRCFTIYVSFFLGILFFPLIGRTKIAAIPSSLVLVISLMPMGLDVALATLGIHESSTTTRTVTGPLFGLALSVVLAPVLEEVTGKLLTHFKLSSEMTKLTDGIVPLPVDALHPKPNLRYLQSALNQLTLSNHQTATENPQRTPYATKTR
jgi:uncharacterized membrane protein